MSKNTNTKIFKVEDRQTGTVRLVDATTAGAALHHTASVSIASARDVATAMALGVRVEIAGAANEGESQ